jgi:hypothetical protein
MTVRVPPRTLTPGRYVLTLFVHRPFVKIRTCARGALVVVRDGPGVGVRPVHRAVDCGCVFVDCAWDAAPPVPRGAPAAVPRGAVPAVAV